MVCKFWIEPVALARVKRHQPKETPLRLSATAMESTGRTLTKISVSKEGFTEFRRRIPRSKPCKTAFALESQP